MKIVAAGETQVRFCLTFQEYLEKLGTDPKRWGKTICGITWFL